MPQLVPILSSSPIHSSLGENFSWITIQNNERQLYAQAVYTINHSNNYDTVNTHTVGTTNGTVLSANPYRKALYCRNLTPTLSSSGALYVKFGAGASDTSFNVILKCASDGFGESFFDEQVYQGEVSIYCQDSNRKYLVWEGY
jgi:hypothetical protein